MEVEVEEEVKVVKWVDATERAYASRAEACAKLNVTDPSRAAFARVWRLQTTAMAAWPR